MNIPYVSHPAREVLEIAEEFEDSLNRPINLYYLLYSLHNGITFYAPGARVMLIERAASCFGLEPEGHKAPCMMRPHVKLFYS
jgi:hypothetical protein